MTLTNSNLDQVTFAEALSLSRQAECGLMDSPVSATPCAFDLSLLVQRIEPAKVRNIVGAVFADLLRLLEYLRLIESHLRQAEAAATHSIFQIIYDEASVLVEFIRDERSNCAVMNKDLADTLDGITFAVNHDMQRAFETELRGATSQNPSETSNLNIQVPTVLLVSKLYCAHDVLTNCLQQSTITLALMFDKELDVARFFNNSDTRYRQSVQLCQDLSSLLKLAKTCRKKRSKRTLSSLTAGIEAFRDESMQYLSYSDWPQFESFCKRIQLASTSSKELEAVLHQFRCYLETLLGQVRMQAVIANIIPIQFGAHDTVQLPTAGYEQLTQFCAPFDPQDQNPLAVAV